MEKCNICGKGTLKRKTVIQTFKYKGQNFDFEQPGLWCDSCGEGILDNSDMEATESLLHDFRCKVDGFLRTSEVRRIRKKLGLTQREAGRLFGGGHNAFSRYERGLARQPKGTDHLLRILDRHPELLNELEEAKAA